MRFDPNAKAEPLRGFTDPEAPAAEGKAADPLTPLVRRAAAGDGSR